MILVAAEPDSTEAALERELAEAELRADELLAAIERKEKERIRRLAKMRAARVVFSRS